MHIPKRGAPLPSQLTSLALPNHFPLPHFFTLLSTPLGRRYSLFLHTLGKDLEGKFRL